MYSEVRLSEGRLYFNLTGGERCNDKHNYNLQVLLMCEYSMIKSPINLMPYVSYIKSIK